MLQLRKLQSHTTTKKKSNFHAIPESDDLNTYNTEFYKYVIGDLQFLEHITRMDIEFETAIIARYATAPTYSGCCLVTTASPCLRIVSFTPCCGVFLRYLINTYVKNSPQHGLIYQYKESTKTLTGLAD